MAQTTLVHHPVRAFNRDLAIAHATPRPDLPRSRLTASSELLHLNLSSLHLTLASKLATCLLHLSWKVATLVAITSARKVSEIGALTSELPYMIFKDKVQLLLHPPFLPKQFHCSQAIFLTVFYSKPHVNREEQRLCFLDVMRVLVFYIQRTKPFHRLTPLFIVIENEGPSHLRSEKFILDYFMHPGML